MSEFPPHPRQTFLDHVWGTVHDQDGRRVRHLRAEKRRKQVRGWDRRKEFGRARWRATPLWAKWMMATPLVAFLVLITCVVVATVLSSAFGVHFGHGVGVAFGYLAPIGIIAVILAGLVMMNVDDRAATRAMLSMRVCVGCFYDLRGTPEREAGVVVCPECGSAWRVEDVDG
ncbi:MAG: hypothetical protein R3B57_08065 [Phycisphaerales bacterium]